MHVNQNYLQKQEDDQPSMDLFQHLSLEPGQPLSGKHHQRSPSSNSGFFSSSFPPQANIVQDPDRGGSSFQVFSSVPKLALQSEPSVDFESDWVDHGSGVRYVSPLGLVGDHLGEVFRPPVSEEQFLWTKECNVSLESGKDINIKLERLPERVEESSLSDPETPLSYVPRTLKQHSGTGTGGSKSGYPLPDASHYINEDEPNNLSLARTRGPWESGEDSEDPGKGDQETLLHRCPFPNCRGGPHPHHSPQFEKSSGSPVLRNSSVRICDTYPTNSGSCNYSIGRGSAFSKIRNNVESRCTSRNISDNGYSRKARVFLPEPNLQLPKYKYERSGFSDAISGFQDLDDASDCTFSDDDNESSSSSCLQIGPQLPIHVRTYPEKEVVEEFEEDLDVVHLTRGLGSPRSAPPQALNTPSSSSTSSPPLSPLSPMSSSVSISSLSPPSSPLLSSSLSPPPLSSPLPHRGRPCPLSPSSTTLSSSTLSVPPPTSPTSPTSRAISRTFQKLLSPSVPSSYSPEVKRRSCVNSSHREERNPFQFGHTPISVFTTTTNAATTSTTTTPTTTTAVITEVLVTSVSSSPVLTITMASASSSSSCSKKSQVFCEQQKNIPPVYFDFPDLGGSPVPTESLHCESDFLSGKLPSVRIPSSSSSSSSYSSSPSSSITTLPSTSLSISSPLACPVLATEDEVGNKSVISNRGVIPEDVRRIAFKFIVRTLRPGASPDEEMQICQAVASMENRLYTSAGSKGEYLAALAKKLSCMKTELNGRQNQKRVQ
ncbi:uncharacterized protein LOC143028130 [Oratosquilla oratoria]|uniref:uncharacterized protein LOC143028130 n=1 Tax=Oratosquilla oratoria TaxID=337810 RepID=UPI003F75C156